MGWLRRLRFAISLFLAPLLAADQTERVPLRPDEKPQDEDQLHIDPEPLEPPEEIGPFQKQDRGNGEEVLLPSLVSGNKTANFSQCRSHNADLIMGPGKVGDRDLTMMVQEGFPSSFKNGSQIRFLFENVGFGVNLVLPFKVPLHAFAPNESKPLPSGAPGFRPGTLRLIGKVAVKIKPDLALLPVRKTSAVAVYEVQNADDLIGVKGSVRRAIIDVRVAFISNTSQNLPSLGQTVVGVVFVPNPRYSPTADKEPFFRNLFTINTCSQSLLFPFVTNQRGADTRIVIANTSLDPYWTVSQEGTVKFYFYGNVGEEKAVKPIVTETIPAGDHLEFTLSQEVPGFEGYVFAVANFQYCHGMAFINRPDGSSHSYQAVQIDREGRSRQDGRANT